MELDDTPDKHDTGWLPIPSDWLLNSWVEFSKDFPLRYRVKDGEVYLSGMIKTGTPTSYAIQLPKNLCPYYTVILPAVGNNVFACVKIRGSVFATHNGKVEITTGSSVGTSLNGIRWFINEGEAG